MPPAGVRGGGIRRYRGLGPSLYAACSSLPVQSPHPWGGHLGTPKIGSVPLVHSYAHSTAIPALRVDHEPLLMSPRYCTLQHLASKIAAEMIA